MGDLPQIQLSRTNQVGDSAPGLETRIDQIGREIFARARHPQDPWLRHAPWDDWLMDIWDEG